MQAWLSSSLVRHYPRSRPRTRQSLTLDAARGETISFQVAFRTADEDLRLTAAAAAPGDLDVELRRVGYVPMHHHTTETPAEELDGLGHVPGLVPDPLLPEKTVHAGPFETNAFWATVRIPADVKPGRRLVQITLTPECLDVSGSPRGQQPSLMKLVAILRVHRSVLPRRRDFPVTHWFQTSALCDWYHTHVWEESFWSLLDSYLVNIRAHGQDTIHVPSFSPPVAPPLERMPIAQLLAIRRDGDQYLFGWDLVRRWVHAAKALGFSYFEWPDFFSYGDVRSSMRTYEGHGEDAKLLWPAETGALSATYRNFLTQFVREFAGFLKAEGIQDCSFFHISDEPEGEEAFQNYRAARLLLRELAPWIKVTDGVDNLRFCREGLTDTPVPGPERTLEFARAGFRPWATFCMGPRGRYLNRFLDTPLIKLRMAGWLFYKTGVGGFLHWAYNHWYDKTQLIDPYVVTDAGAWPVIPSGDAFIVYPGPSGPVDSLRWELLAESLQDYALLQAAQVALDAPLLSEIRDYADFPRRESWLTQRRRQVLARLDREH